MTLSALENSWPHIRTQLGFHPPSLTLLKDKVNSVTGRKKAPLDWRSWCLNVGPGSVFIYFSQTGNQSYLIMEAAQPIRHCRILGCRCGPTEGSPATTFPGWGLKSGFLLRPSSNAACSEFLYRWDIGTATYLERTAK